jgi:predicted nucleic acid-binding protein
LSFALHAYVGNFGPQCSDFRGTTRPRSHASPRLCDWGSGSSRAGRVLFQANAIENWLVAVDKAFGEHILPIDHAVGGRLNASRPLSVIDGLLAATAKIHRMTLVTRNTADIADLDVPILNPFELR